MESVIEARRAKFEAWSAENSGASLQRDCRGGYLSFSSMQLWAAYNAALDSLVIELPGIPEWRKDSEIRGSQLRPDLLLKEGEEYGIRQCRQAIEKAGVKTK